MNKRNLLLPVSAITLFFGIFMLLNSQVTPTGAFLGGAEMSLSPLIGLGSLVVSGVSYFMGRNAHEDRKSPYE